MKIMKVILNIVFISIILTSCCNLSYNSIHGFKNVSLKCVNKYENVLPNNKYIWIDYHKNPILKDSLNFVINTFNLNDKEEIAGKYILSGNYISNTYILIEKKYERYKKYKIFRMSSDCLSKIRNGTKNEKVSLRLHCKNKSGKYRVKVVSGYYEIEYCLPFFEKRYRIESDWEYFKITN